MKVSHTASAVYESPESWVIDISSLGIVCTSLYGDGNEEYEEGNTSGWFNN